MKSNKESLIELLKTNSEVKEAMEQLSKLKFIVREYIDDDNLDNFIEQEYKFIGFKTDFTDFEYSCNGCFITEILLSSEGNQEIEYSTHITEIDAPVNNFNGTREEVIFEVKKYFKEILEEYELNEEQLNNSCIVAEDLQERFIRMYCKNKNIFCGLNQDLLEIGFLQKRVYIDIDNSKDFNNQSDEIYGKILEALKDL